MSCRQAFQMHFLEDKVLYFGQVFLTVQLTIGSDDGLVLIRYYLMAGHAFVLGKEVFYHGNGNILTLEYWLNGVHKLILCTFNYIRNHLYSMKNFNHFKLKYTDSCNFLTKRAMVSQPSMLMVAKDSNILHYLNISIYQLLSFPLNNTHPTWLSLTNELKFDD